MKDLHPSDPCMVIRRWIMMLTLILITGFASCNSAGSTQTEFGQPEFSASVFTERAKARLQLIIDSAISSSSVSNAVLLVDAPAQSFRFQGGAGVAYSEDGLPMTADQPFRIASITKTMTAAAVMQLVEEGYVSLDTTLGGIFVDADMPSGYQVADLHVLDGIKRGSDITVRQLLSHTSGLEDYLSYNNKTNDGPDFLALMDALNGGGAGFATRQWTPQELLAGYFHNNRGKQPAGLPGARHYYSDTNYLLLGLMIEKLTGDHYANQLRARIFEPLNMRQTYLEWYEPTHGDAPVDHSVDVGDPLGNVDIARLDINTSFDWAGGGVVSTASDLNTFMRALIKGDLFQSHDSWAQMQAWVHNEDATFYGLGLERFTLGGLAVVGHSGFWGGAMYYFPELDVSIVLWINQANTDSLLYLNQVLHVLAKPGFDIAHHPLQSITRGFGAPTVVFEAGHGSSMKEAWIPVFKEVAAFTRVFAYNRRGYGASKFALPGDTVVGRAGAEIVDDLRRTLKNKGMSAPYILVGHSLGGAYIELFAKTYPNEVAGVVFVDPRPVGITEACIKALDSASCDIPANILDRMPAHQRAELLGFTETERLVQAAGDFGDIPVIVLSRSEFGMSAVDQVMQVIWQDLLQDMAAQSSNGVYLEVPGTGHHIQYDAPEVVIRSIQQLIN